MGSYCSLKINDYEFDSSKSYINPFYALIFHETDRRIRRVHYSEYYTMPIEEENLVDCIEYVLKIGDAKDRLDLLGFKLEDSIKAYHKLLEEKLESYKEYEYNLGISHLTTLLTNDFKFWLDTIRIIITKNFHSWDLSLERDISKDDIYSFLVDQASGPEEWLLGYPSNSFGLALRAILEAMPDSDELVLDVTSLIYAGYYEKDEPICLNTNNNAALGAIPFQKTLILTEGSTDTLFLSKSLKLLYPHLHDYFSFLDFSEVRPDGGNVGLEKMIKVLAAAGVHNNIVALFDNDTAGHLSIKALKRHKLQPNIKILSLPDLDFATSYPTKGPHGLVVDNINGRACAIELYLGTNILKGNNGDLIPINWTGLEKSLSQYQGEIEDKSIIQEKFREILKNCEKDKSLIQTHDWYGLSLIFKMIFDKISTDNSNFNKYQVNVEGCQE